MRTSWICIGLLLIASTAFTASLSAEDEPTSDAVSPSDDPPAPSEAAWRARVCAPLDAVRDAAIYALTTQPDRARELSRTWVGADTAWVRAQGWRVLGLVGTSDDIKQALDAVSDAGDGQVAAAAAAALLQLAERHEPTSGPWLDGRRPLATESRRLLGVSLIRRLRESGDVPRAVQHLGEDVIASLLVAYRASRDSLRVRTTVMRALGRMASAGARTALVQLASEITDDRSAWFDALVACGPGPELRPLHEWIQTFAGVTTRRRRARWPGWRSWRDRRAFYKFLATYPDDRWASPVRDRMRALLGTNSWHSSLLLSATRVLLVLGNPTDEDLEAVVDASAHSLTQRPDRFEGLGEILATLRPYEAREAVVNALRARGPRSMPRTSWAWSRVLLGMPPADLRAAAAALLDTKPQLGPCLRAGARILNSCGGPSAEQVRAHLDHGDAWMRAWAVQWSDRTLPEAEAQAALRTAAVDSDLGVALVASERATNPGPTHLGRVADIAAFGRSPALRSRAWRVLDRVLRTRPSPADADARPALPRGHDSMDERLRGLGLVRTWIDADSPTDHEQGLPTPAGQGR